MDVAVDGNYSALIISGFPSQLELQISWSEIQQEYADAMGNAEHKAYLSALREIAQLRAKLTVIYEAVDLLRKAYYAPVAAHLNKLIAGSFAFDYKDPEKYHADLTRCLNRSKSIKIMLDMKMIKFQGIIDKFQVKGEEAKPTREYYHSWLISLSDHAKYQLQENITVFEFCSRIKRYIAYCDSMNKANKKKF